MTVSAEHVEPLCVELPPDLKAFFEESGYLPTTAMEFRGNARLRVRSDATLSFLHGPANLIQGIDPLPNQSTILIKDLSRSGIGFLYHRQLYPTQALKVVFQGRDIETLVVRCRRLGDRCFEIGGRVLSTRQHEGTS